VVFITPGWAAARQFDAAAAGAPLDAAIGMSASETIQTVSSQWQLETIGRQFSEPIDTLSALRKPADTHSPALLPAVPAAISMTLCGFLCISFVRDRRAWLAVACGLLWLGQAGICTTIANRRQIPVAACKAGITGRSGYFARSYRHAFASHAAVVASRCNHFNDVNRCPADSAGQFIVFSPAFIFSNLSRGPPPTEMRVFVT